MDNFDHENTTSGIEGSHDTILMLFQNGENNVENNENKALSHILDCQKLRHAKKWQVETRSRRILYLESHTKQKLLETHQILTLLPG